MTRTRKRDFSVIWGSTAISITARAVARGVNGNIGILMLDPHLKDSTEIDGNVNILNNGQIFSNSDNTVTNDSPLTGSVYVANTSTISVAGINARGALNNSGTINYYDGGSFQTYTNLIADPLAAIPEPTTAGLTNYGTVNVTTNSTLSPGIYTDINIGATGKTASSPTVTLSPGIYYITDGVVLNAGTLTGTGVMFFYDTTKADNFLNNTKSGTGGVVNITPPTATSGGTWPTGTTSATYNGISVWLPRLHR